MGRIDPGITEEDSHLSYDSFAEPKGNTKLISTSFTSVDAFLLFLERFDTEAVRAVDHESIRLAE